MRSSYWSDLAAAAELAQAAGAASWTATPPSWHPLVWDRHQDVGPEGEEVVGFGAPPCSLQGTHGP